MRTMIAITLGLVISMSVIMVTEHKEIRELHQVMIEGNKKLWNKNAELHDAVIERLGQL